MYSHVLSAYEDALKRHLLEWQKWQAEVFAAEQAYLCSLDFTDEQLAAYTQRIDGIHDRLAAYLERGRMAS